ncbi:MAG: NAD(P)-dependent oxidoreductase [Bacteroidales bacterium]|nr:NAD(P)-dependent oxidoreductase [Bacteroidales bacterium]
MKKILIVGGLGFIGYHLSRKLCSQFEIYVVDALINYIPNNYKAWNYYTMLRQQELNNLGIPCFINNVNDLSFKQLVVNIKPDIIVNAASMPVALLADINPSQAKQDIFDSQFQLLETIRTSPINLSQYIYISSSMVYGNFLRDDAGKIIPASEEQACHPIDGYGAFKLANEIIIQQYHKKYNLPFTIIRPSAVYGPTDCNLRVTEIFLRKGFEHGTIELDNGGLHELDFTYIEDLCQGISLAINNPKSIHQIFNISYGQGRKIAELAQIVKQMFPDVKIISNECKPFRPNRGAMNITKAKEMLNYRPQVDLEQGMMFYRDFLKHHIGLY